MFGCPLAYHERVVDAIRAYGDQPICAVADITESLIRLRKSIAAHRKAPSDSAIRAKGLEADWYDLLFRARALQTSNNPYVLAASRAVELVLYLSWYPERETNLTYLATELKEALCGLPVRPCLFMDLTSCQMMLGAIASVEGSETRAWFVARMRNAVVTLRSRGWERPLEILEQGFAADEGMGARFRTLRRELDG